MSGLPVLSIIVLAPATGGLLIALFGGNPRVPKAIGLLVSAISLAG